MLYIQMFRRLVRYYGGNSDLTLVLQKLAARVRAAGWPASAAQPLVPASAGGRASATGVRKIASK